MLPRRESESNDSQPGVELVLLRRSGVAGDECGVDGALVGECGRDGGGVARNLGEQNLVNSVSV
jgi:hypothetical protein